jgi:hypothetical protein
VEISSSYPVSHTVPEEMPITERVTVAKPAVTSEIATHLLKKLRKKHEITLACDLYYLGISSLLVHGPPSTITKMHLELAI